MEASRCEVTEAGEGDAPIAHPKPPLFFLSARDRYFAYQAYLARLRVETELELE